MALVSTLSLPRCDKNHAMPSCSRLLVRMWALRQARMHFWPHCHDAFLADHRCTVRHRQWQRHENFRWPHSERLWPLELAKSRAATGTIPENPSETPPGSSKQLPESRSDLDGFSLCLSINLHSWSALSGESFCNRRLDVKSIPMVASWRNDLRLRVIAEAAE